MYQIFYCDAFLGGTIWSGKFLYRLLKVRLSILAPPVMVALVDLPPEILLEVAIRATAVHALRLTCRYMHEIVNAAMAPSTHLPVFSVIAKAKGDNSKSMTDFCTRLVDIASGPASDEITKPSLCVRIWLDRFNPDPTATFLLQILQAAHEQLDRVTKFKLFVKDGSDSHLPPLPIFGSPARALLHLAVTLPVPCEVFRAALRGGWLSGHAPQLRSLYLSGINLPSGILLDRVRVLHLAVLAKDLEAALLQLPTAVPNLQQLKIVAPSNVFERDSPVVPSLTPALTSFLHTLASLYVASSRPHYTSALEPLCTAFGGSSLHVRLNHHGHPLLGSWLFEGPLRLALVTCGIMTKVTITGENREYIAESCNSAVDLLSHFAPLRDHIKELAAEEGKCAGAVMALWPNFPRLKILPPPDHPPTARSVPHIRRRIE